MGSCFLDQIKILRASYTIVKQIYELVDGTEEAAKVGGHLIVGFNVHLNLAGMVAVLDDLEHHAHPRRIRGCAISIRHSKYSPAWGNGCAPFLGNAPWKIS